MISLLAPCTWCSSDADSWVLTMMAYWVQGFSDLIRCFGFSAFLPSVERDGGSTSAMAQLLEPHASCPSNSVTFLYGLEHRERAHTLISADRATALELNNVSDAKGSKSLWALA